MTAPDRSVSAVPTSVDERGAGRVGEAAPAEVRVNDGPDLEGVVAGDAGVRLRHHAPIDDATHPEANGEEPLERSAVGHDLCLPAALLEQSEGHGLKGHSLRKRERRVPGLLQLGELDAIDRAVIADEF